MACHAMPAHGQPGLQAPFPSWVSCTPIRSHRTPDLVEVIEDLPRDMQELPPLGPAGAAAGPGWGLHQLQHQRPPRHDLAAARQEVAPDLCAGARGCVWQNSLIGSLGDIRPSVASRGDPPVARYTNTSRQAGDSAVICNWRWSCGAESAEVAWQGFAQ